LSPNRSAMSEPRPDQPAPADRPPGGADASAPPPFVPTGPPTDDTPTVISRIRPATTEDAIGGLRGRRLAHFELLDAVGVGGMAAVLRARDTQLDRTVALKILPPEMAADPENVRRFHQEARSAAKLDHENIARVFFCGEDQRLHFIAFEFVEGDNLRTILERRGRLPVGEALHYMLQVAAGLAHAAARGVVHRDIKPSNIIVTPSGRAKLVDMGLARSLERHDQGLTQSGVTLGTFDYISPEQALEPRDADVRSDIYSLGCTFYHMLTGQPPVPEGTAAKKLHHHQHVKPTDPRELAPGIPDEVAMILARMMAKNPRDRYQTPEHLFHDLLLALRKVGGGGTAPEGVLAVEASLPPPSYRPMLLVALAAAAVVALILVLAPSSTPPHRPGPGPHTDITDKDGPRPSPKDGGPKDVVKEPPKDPVPPAVAKYDAEDVNADRLANWLKDHQNADRIEIELARDLDLQVRDGPDPLVVKANRVVIRSKYPRRRATIRLSYGLGKPAPRTALTVDSKEASLEGLRVVLDGGSSEGSMTGLKLQGGGQYAVRNCEFLQARPSFTEQQRLASVVLANAAGPGGGDPRAALTLSECTFLGFDTLQTDLEGTSLVKLLLTGAERGGQDAVVRRGPGLLKVSDCAFGPHAAAFRFEGGAGDRDLAAVRHCTVMAGRGSAAFHFADDAAAVLDVQCSLFSRPGEAAAEPAAKEDAAVLIRQAGRAAVVYRGSDNRYHNLNGYWLGGEHEETTFTAFRDALPKTQVGDTSGKEDPASHALLTASPWKEDQPLAAFPAALPPDKPGYAVRFVDATRKPPDDEDDQLAPVFQVKADQADLRAADAPDKSLIGVEHLGTIQYTSKLPPLAEKKPDPTARRTLIVDPTVAVPRDDVYPSLEQAILAARRPGDLILIRHTGELSVEPMALKQAAIDVTIRPDADQRPVLTLAKSEEVDDAAMFRLNDGKLRLEGLEFRLRPAQRARSQAVATLVGDGQCAFKDCAITLDPGGQDVPLAAVTFPDNEGVMMMKGGPPGAASASPRLTFENCFVRGKGDLIWSRVSRPFELKMENTLVALDGHALSVEVGDSAAPGAPAMSMPNVNATLSHTTAYLSGYLVRLKAGKDLKAMVPVRFTADRSLFVASAGQAFIHLDGPDTNEEKLKEKLIWTGEQNAFAGYNNEMIDHRPASEDARPLTMMQDRWKLFAGDAGSSKFYPRVKFTAPPGDTPFARLTPGQLKPADLNGVGADVQQVPRPSGEPR